MSNIPAFPTTPAPTKKSFVKRYLPYIAVAMVGIVLGIVMGASGNRGDSDAAPAPAVTVTETVEVEAAPDTTCRDVAAELWDMLDTSNSSVSLPLLEVNQSLLDQLIYGQDLGAIERDTAKLEGVNSSLESLTDRVGAVSEDYLTCVG